MKFPQDFTWGAATAAFQIEGASTTGGRGESIWDRFCRTPGKVRDGDTGDQACDHYNRWREDVALMHDLGLNAYRFSIAWPRLLPEGRGRINPAGLDFYSRLVDGLLENGLEPYATLYHWDLPQALQDQGGWPARPTIEAFTEYTDLATRRLGDRVKNWITINEPHVSAFIGHLYGSHAPGHESLDEALVTAHHLLLAHGEALPVIRRNSPGCQAGIVLNLAPVYPASPSEADQQAAIIQDGMQNRWFLEPLAGYGYPQDTVAFFDLPLDFVLPGDLEIIARPVDFLGENYYTRQIARNEMVPPEQNLPQEVFPNPDSTEMGWEIFPEGLYDVLNAVHQSYHFPALMVTENGAAVRDEIAPDGAVHDPRRIAYYEQHLAQVERAVQDGIPVKGYFAWSLLDNFEWAHGYSKRFGLIYVDYPTQRRIPKDSFYWWQRFLKS